MNEFGPPLALFVLGLFLAVVYFGGLWWTLRRLATTRRPGMLLTASTILRLAVVIAVLALLVTDDWRDFFIALAGFLTGRVLLGRWFLHSPPAANAAHHTGASGGPADSEPATGESSRD